MNKEVKKKWLKALRSGEYDQGKGCLLTRTSKGDKFCCLGVLCNLYAQAHPGTGFKDEFESYSFFDESYQLPIKVRNWAKISKSKKFDYDHYKVTAGSKLMQLNDMDNCNFNEIADWIEENL